MFISRINITIFKANFFIKIRKIYPRSSKIYSLFLIQKLTMKEVKFVLKNVSYRVNCIKKKSCKISSQLSKNYSIVQVDRNSKIINNFLKSQNLTNCKILFFKGLRSL